MCGVCVCIVFCVCVGVWGGGGWVVCIVCVCALGRFDSEHPYQMLDSSHRQIQEKEGVMAALVESASLFEVTVPDYRQLRQCRYQTPPSLTHPSLLNSLTMTLD